MNMKRGCKQTLSINNSDELRSVFASRLYYAIERRGQTPAAFARECGISHATIYRYIRGEKLPNMTTLRIVAAVLDVSCEWLLVMTRADRKDIWSQIKTVASTREAVRALKARRAHERVKNVLDEKGTPGDAGTTDAKEEEDEAEHA